MSKNTPAVTKGKAKAKAAADFEKIINDGERATSPALLVIWGQNPVPRVFMLIRLRNTQAENGDRMKPLPTTSSRETADRVPRLRLSLVLAHRLPAVLA
jgi:hypothetical protein